MFYQWHIHTSVRSIARWTIPNQPQTFKHSLWPRTVEGLSSWPNATTYATNLDSREPAAATHENDSWNRFKKNTTRRVLARVNYCVVNVWWRCPEKSKIEIAKYRFFTKSCYTASFISHCKCWVKSVGRRCLSNSLIIVLRKGIVRIT